MTENYKIILEKLRDDMKLTQKEMTKYEKLIEEEIRNAKNKRRKI